MNTTITPAFFDTETVPSQREDIQREIAAGVEAEKAEELASVKAPSNYKDEAKITEYVASKKAEIEQSYASKFDERLHATGLDGAFGEVFCIGAAVHDDEPVIFSRADGYTKRDTERSVIKGFFDYVNSGSRYKVELVGHNIVGFDIRFLHQRCMVLGIRPPIWLPLDPKPWDSSVFDTMVRWAGARDRVKLSKLCKAFGIEDTDEIDGSEVWDCIKRGEYAKVAEHCRIDIRKVRVIYNRMNFTQE